MIPNTEAAGIGRRLVEGARALYADLNAQLQQTLAQLKRDYLTDEAKGLADALKAHRKALQTLLDIELSFGKSAERGSIQNHRCPCPELRLRQGQASRTGRWALCC